MSSRYGPVTLQFLQLIQSENASAVTYLSLHRDRAAYIEAWKRLYADENLQAIVMPVSRYEQPRRSDAQTMSPALDPETSGLYTYAFNYNGFPVAMTPAGQSAATGLPVGVQIGGPPFSESNLLQIAVDYQQHFPPLAGGSGASGMSDPTGTDAAHPALLTVVGAPAPAPGAVHPTGTIDDHPALVTVTGPAPPSPTS